MPMKFVTRSLKANFYYHVYNRGLGGNDIFLAKEDYETFLKYLTIYTESPDLVAKTYPELPDRLKNKNLNGEITVVGYALMPDHFHLVVKQKTAKALPKFMKQLINAYTTYFKAKYKRAGGVMQGRYRAAPIESEFLVIQVVRFVLVNPVVAGFCLDPRAYVWSSINNHGESNELLNQFGSVDEWEQFHLDSEGYKASLPKISGLTID